MYQHILNPATGQPFIELMVTDSTNNYAMALAKKGQATHGLAVFSHHQTAGRGQRGKVWQDVADHNIALSVLLNAKGLPVSSLFTVNMAVALATQRFFASFAGDETTIKWPNDIYWRDRKAAGILIENQFTGKDWQWVVAGIGVNINQVVFDIAATNPVSLKQITGKTFNTVQLAQQLAALVVENFNAIAHTPATTFLQHYNQLLYKRNETVTLKKDAVVFKCTIKEVTLSGELVTQGALQQQFAFGEVQWVINNSSN